ncbi:helix-turn-helix domain-containing protein [Murimonas intestini]|uniref:helix-turn-helix domain-containing protein n=1 Tax=Murimonas intestini TaxID=1337051 RepID=UPI0011DD81CC|nr:helix-turn-helix transcriptional regulator [Murimonas intestini]
MFGEIIQNLRKSHGINQVELAQKLGVTKQAVSNWENNNILPSIDMLIKISRFFSVSCDYLLEIDHRSFIEVSGLTIEELSHIQQVINDIKK